MVSLSPESDRAIRQTLHDNEYQTNEDFTDDDTPLIAVSEKPYRRSKTTGFIILHILISIILAIFIGGYPTLCVYKNMEICTRNHSPYNIALYTHAASYIIQLIFDRIYHSFQDALRRDGYLQFYRKTRNLRRTPLIIFSMGNAMLVGIIQVLEDEQTHLKDFKREHALLILISLETLVTLTVLVWYLVLTVRFNKQRARPDANQEDYLSTFNVQQPMINEVGFRDETYREDVIEKQGDLIRYLRERNAFLLQKIQQMTEINQTSGRA